MKILYEDITWWVYMMILYEDFVCRFYMKIFYEEFICMIYILYKHFICTRDIFILR